MRQHDDSHQRFYVCPLVECGSREASERSLEVTQDVAEQTVKLGWIVVSGHARGVDQTAHLTALKNGGCTIIVAAEGIDQFRLRAELKSIAKPDQILIISEFDPNARWTAGNAMKRNRTIVGLSDALIVLEARLQGGTLDAGKRALQFKVPLYVAEYQDNKSEGNQYLLKRGANPLKRSADTKRANLVHIEEHVARRTESHTLPDSVEMQPQLL